jgi:hypothetical protein
MRLNAPIPALLALAALYFLPAESLAQPTHRRAHKTTTHAPTHRRHVAVPADTRDAATKTTRVHTQPATTHHKTRHAIQRVRLHKGNPTQLTANASASEKATSDDFLKAAEAPARSQPLSPFTEHRALTNRAKAARPSSRKHASVAKPAPVVSVVRRNSQRPRLPSVEEAAATPVILPTPTTSAADSSSRHRSRGPARSSSARTR